MASSLEKEVSSHYAEEVQPREVLKKSPEGITLIPQPSEDPKDPLNWPLRKKILTTALWSLGAYVSTASGLGNAQGYFVQADVYHKSPHLISYSVVACTAGIAVGPLFAVPLATRYGRSLVFFWSMIGLLATGIWSACMNDSDQYIPFVMARLIAGFFGGNSAALGSQVLVDLWFLHQRGKAFTALNLCFLLGVVQGPTFSGFIVQSAPWQVQFWWTVGLEGVIIVLAFFLLEDTYYDRQASDNINRRQWPTNFAKNRMATFLCRPRVVPQITWRQTVWQFSSSIVVGLSPVSLLVGGFILVDFGFAAFANIILAIFLQDPVEEGGYGFSPLRSAYFTFSLWCGVICAELYGHFVSDRLPLWLCARRGGIWKPEYRLHTLWFPCFFILPIGLGLFGAALFYHLHYMVLALACFLIGYSTNAAVPITINYLVECFVDYAQQATTILGLYRLAMGLSLPFFAPAWIDRVGANWCLGMAAFFTLFAYTWIIALMWKGPAIRQWSFKSVYSSEAGEKVVGAKDDLSSGRGSP